MVTTNKQIVREFLYFLKEHKGVVNTGNRTFNYKDLYNAIIDVIDVAMKDGFSDGWNKAETSSFFDISVSQNEDIGF